MSQSVLHLLIIFLFVNVVTFVLFGIDKQKAKERKWRIPEFTLLFWCFLGGALGGLLGMKIFRHKTQHWKFTILIPLFLILQITLGITYYS